MVKKQKSSNYLDAYLIRFNVFAKKKIDTTKQGITALVLLAVLIILSLVYSNMNYAVDLSLPEAIFGIPALLALFFAGFYVFLNGLEDNRKPFWQSLFVSLSIIVPIMIVANIVNMIAFKMYSSLMISSIYSISILDCQELTKSFDGKYLWSTFCNPNGVLILAH